MLNIIDKINADGNTTIIFGHTIEDNELNGYWYLITDETEKDRNGLPWEEWINTAEAETADGCCVGMFDTLEEAINDYNNE